MLFHFPERIGRERRVARILNAYGQINLEEMLRLDEKIRERKNFRRKGNNGKFLWRIKWKMNDDFNNFFPFFFIDSALYLFSVLIIVIIHNEIATNYL